MFEPRPNEPDYAFVPEVEHPAANCYGQPIETVPEGHALRNESLNINGDAAVSDNPDRYKQHGFYFNADHCIACHACEAACSEKNDLPGAHRVSLGRLCGRRFVSRLPAPEYFHGLQPL